MVAEFTKKEVSIFAASREEFESALSEKVDIENLLSDKKTISYKRCLSRDERKYRKDAIDFRIETLNLFKVLDFDSCVSTSDPLSVPCAATLILSTSVDECINKVGENSDNPNYEIYSPTENTATKPILPDDAPEIELIQGIGACYYHLSSYKQVTIRKLAVLREHQNQGWGRLLIYRVICKAIEENKTSIFLKCPANLAANQFYEKLGFELETTEQGKNQPLNHWRYYIKLPLLFYCGGGGKSKYDAIALNSGWNLGINSNGKSKAHQHIPMVDNDWKNYSHAQHLEMVRQNKPLIATARDIEHPEQLPEILIQATELAQYAGRILLIPKCDVALPDYWLGYSVPSKYGKTNLQPEWFGSRPVHLLGGSPKKQALLYPQMNVISLDANYAMNLASKCKAVWSDGERNIEEIKQNCFEALACSLTLQFEFWRKSSVGGGDSKPALAILSAPAIPEGIQKVELRFIKEDIETQSRKEIDKQTVEDYLRQRKSGVELPAIKLFFDILNNFFFIGDGWHRYLAEKEIGEFIVADVKYGSKRDAVLYSCGANSTHGLRRTSEDKRKAVTTLLLDSEWSLLSNREISRRCGVDEGMVRKYRNMGAEIPHSSRKPAHSKEVFPRKSLISTDCPEYAGLQVTVICKPDSESYIVLINGVEVIILAKYLVEIPGHIKPINSVKEEMDAIASSCGIPVGGLPSVKRNEGIPPAEQFEKISKLQASLSQITENSAYLTQIQIMQIIELINFKSLSEADLRQLQRKVNKQLDKLTVAV